MTEPDFLLTDCEDPTSPRIIQKDKIARSCLPPSGWVLCELGAIPPECWETFPKDGNNWCPACRERMSKTIRLYPQPGNPL